MARESLAQRRVRAAAIDAALAKAYPRSTCALDHASPFQLLVATVLSAQTTDVAVNRVTPALFARWPTAQRMARASPEAIGGVINSIGLWRAKAKNLHALAQMLVAEFGGEVPRTLEELVRLPGVGRKTATAVLGMAFHIPAGVTVDTHMVRINRLLGLTRATGPERIAKDLEALLPPERWTAYTHRVIDHGRLVCVARRPRCGACPVQALCPSAFDPKAGYRPENDEKEPASAKGLSWLRTSASPRRQPA
ncbi:MAG TPA: endonuclease III [Candidatus Thermoplasmatota archaeon]|nr:endonuclease III [Candidatus Thermoplasmatota archaeon]